MPRLSKKNTKRFGSRSQKLYYKGLFALCLDEEDSFVSAASQL